MGYSPRGRKRGDTTEQLNNNYVCCILLVAFASNFFLFKNILFIYLAVLVLMVSWEISRCSTCAL